MRKQFYFLGILLLGLAASGCTTTSGKVITPAPSPRPEVTLQVDNQSQFSVQIYAMRGPSRVPLGSVDANQTRVFRVHDGVLNGSDVRLMAARPGRSDGRISEPLDVSTGTHLTWRLMDTPLSGSGPGQAFLFRSPFQPRQ